MKLCMFTPKGAGLDRGWPGRIEGDRIVQLAAQTLQAFFTGGGGAREHADYPLGECDLRAPVLFPPSIRVFRPFERAETPFFSFRSPYPVLGPEEVLAPPEGAAGLDYGLALAAVIGAGGEIGGFTLANDWSLREDAEAERRAGFGPSKSGDFAFSLGPLLVTPDEFVAAGLTARVSGEERCGVDLRELVHSWEAMRAHAAFGTTLRPGEILVAAAPVAAGPPLAPGDLVELEADGIGILRNQIA
jgi:2-keto-4-pentenoate hydratase/2-oxohepta-3-ene-1,7-dioic acid hydratase in catechol pathway